MRISSNNLENSVKYVYVFFINVVFSRIHIGGLKKWPYPYLILYPICIHIHVHATLSGIHFVESAQSDLNKSALTHV